MNPEKLAPTKKRDCRAPEIFGRRHGRYSVARVAVEADVSRCRDCGRNLTADEAYWYSYRCDDCEGDWAERMENYRHGADDPMLDLLFSG